MKPAARRKARQFAVQAMYQWQMTANNLIDIEQYFLQEFDFSKTDLDYFRELLHQVPKQVSELDEHFKSSLDRKLGELDLVELAILRISTYELWQRLDVPYRVVINEGVELSKRFGASESHKFVNGVLDKVAIQLRALEINTKQTTNNIADSL